MRFIFLLALVFGMSSSLWAQHEHHGHGRTSEAAMGDNSPDDGAEGRSPRTGRGSNWTAQPLLLIQRENDRGASTLRLRNSEAELVTVFGPKGGIREFQIEAGKAKIEVADAGTGNYQWVQLREENEHHVGVAATIWYSGLAGPSPRRLLETRRSELEIVPLPLPREHAVYRESEKWRFLVRYEGQPMTEQRLRLETENGSKSVFVTDAEGVATVSFPRDFGAKAGGAGRSGGGGHSRPRMAFVLSTELNDGGRHFITTFNSVYGEDVDRNKSLGWGAAFGVFGMASALPLLRRRKRKENKEQSC